MPLPLCFINLARDQERRARIESELLRLRLDGERIEAVWWADLPATALAPELQGRQRAALAEFVAAQQAMADMPNAQLNLAGLALAQRDALTAEQRLRRALQREPAVDAARLGLATLLAQTRREDEAERVLRDGLARAASPGELHLALGLLAGPRQRWEEAARELRAADALLPGQARVRRNLDAVERYLERTRPR